MCNYVREKEGVQKKKKKKVGSDLLESRRSEGALFTSKPEAEE